MTVASHRAEFVQYDPLANLTVSTPQDVHTHPELKRKIYSALAEGDEGELSIAIPKEVPLKVAGSFHASIAASEGSYSTPLSSASAYSPILAATPEPQTPGASALPTVEFAPITVHIEYSLRNPSDGLAFVRPSDAYPHVRRSRAFVRTLIIGHSVYLMYSQLHRLRTPRDAGSLASTVSGSGVPGTSSL